MKISFKKIWKIVKNPYVISIFIFLMIYLFLGDNNRLLIMRLSRELNDLEREASLLEENIVLDSIDSERVIGNSDALEAYGREHYYMKRADEDIFIIKKEQDQ